LNACSLVIAVIQLVTLKNFATLAGIAGKTIAFIFCIIFYTDTFATAVIKL
jgi:hypothetical protein